MKVHITNSYGWNNEIAEREQLFAKAGQKLGFYELGICVYPAEADSQNELSVRLDGMIAAVEHEDLIIVQLPTGNGAEFEALLMDKLLAYSHRKVLLLWHDESYRAENRERIAGYTGKERFVDPFMQYEEITCQQRMLDMVTQMQKEEHPYMQADEGEATEDGSIQIGFGLYDKYGTYSVWVGTAMQSVIEHTDAAVTFHILHDDTLTEDNRQKLIQVAKSGGQKIRFHHFDSSMFSGVEGMMGHFTIGSMFRLLLPDVLPELSKIIYLDADLFVNSDIKELWDTDIRDYCIAAVRDYGVVKGAELPYPVVKGQVEKENYFNSGVLFLNLDRVRDKGNLLENVLIYLEDNKGAIYPDQDAFNVLFQDSCYLLDDSWNCFVTAIRSGEITSEGKICHYAGNYISLYMKSRTDQMYFEILERTPWGSGEGERLLRSSMNRLTDMAEQNENLLRRIAQNKRKLVFYGPKIKSMQNLMKLLHANEENSIWTEYMNDTVLENRDGYTVCVLPEAENNHGMEILEKHGWKNGTDYFVIPRMVPVSEGGYL